MVIFIVNIIILLDIILGSCQSIDTSYTLNRAAEKVQSFYPNASLAEKADEIHACYNAVYGRVGERSMHFDLYEPLNITTLCPFIIMVHGGGWSSGDKLMMGALASQFAQLNYRVACIEYRLSGEAIYPAAINDIRMAISHFHDHSYLYNIDSTKIVILGCSAGATLASLVAVNHSSGQLAGLINIDGVVDFASPHERKKDGHGTIPRSAAAKFFGCTYEACQSRWIEASAVHQVGSHPPPVLFINSSVERFHAGRDAMIQIYDRFGVKSGIITIDDSPHTFWLFHPWIDQTVRCTHHFIDKILCDKATTEELDSTK